MDVDPILENPSAPDLTNTYFAVHLSDANPNMTIMLIGNKSDLTVSPPQAAMPWHQEKPVLLFSRSPAAAGVVQALTDMSPSYL